MDKCKTYRTQERQNFWVRSGRACGAQDSSRGKTDLDHDKSHGIELSEYVAIKAWLVLPSKGPYAVSA